MKQLGITPRQPFIGWPQDGLIDIFIGLGVVMLGIGISINLPWLALFYIATATVMWRPTQQWIAALCLGHWDQSVEKQRQYEDTLVLVVALGFVLLTIVVVSFPTLIINRLTPGIQGWLGQNIAVLTLISGAVLIAVIGWLSHALHIYAYGILILAGLAAIFLFNIAFDMLLMVIGSVMILGGLYLLIKLTQTEGVSTQPDKQEA